MHNKRVVVTGASGFVGRYVVDALVKKGYEVTAGVHHLNKFSLHDNHVKVIELDILDRKSVSKAMDGAVMLFHFAAQINPGSTLEELRRVNVKGTEVLWECAAESGIKKAIYCSSAAVYGLLGRNGLHITEYDYPCAVEPYGRTKLEGEKAALFISKQKGMKTIIIRPVAIFGPGEHTPFGFNLRKAAYSKLLIAGAFRNKKFNFVHVEDVAAASVYLMELEIPDGEIFNITVNEPILFEKAFVEYIKVLKRLGSSFIKVKILGIISLLLHRLPWILKFLSGLWGGRLTFTIWHPGFDLNYSSDKLLKTSFPFKYTDFGEIFYSSVEKSTK